MAADPEQTVFCLTPLRVPIRSRFFPVRGFDNGAHSHHYGTADAHKFERQDPVR